MSKLYEIPVKTIQGEMISMDHFKGKVLLIVNTASECGFTPQYKGLEALYQKYKDQGFEILGFPCNQFGGQEPGNEKEIQGFCETNFGVTFPLFAKIEVNGPSEHPLYTFLKQESRGFLGTKAIKWNFTKFLVNRQGKVLRRFAPQETPESLASEVEKVLS